MPNQIETVLITGASTGIGRAVARAFLDRGYNLILFVQYLSDVPSERNRYDSSATMKVDAEQVQSTKANSRLVALITAVFRHVAGAQNWPSLHRNLERRKFTP